MIRRNLNYANVAATLALLLSLSGIAYAATLPRNSVGTRQLKASAVTAPKIANQAVTTKKVKDFGLRLRDLGGRGNNRTTTVNSQINVAPGDCTGSQLDGFNPTPDGVVGSLVIGFLTDEQGDAVLDNWGVVVPTMLSETSQGGAITHLMVCDLSTGGQTVPAGSVFHYRMISP